MVLVVRYLVLLGVVSSVESSWSKGKRGSITKREYFDKAQKRREVKDLFKNIVLERNRSYGLASF